MINFFLTFIFLFGNVDGNIFKFVTHYQTCMKWGFPPGARVTTPRGPATGMFFNLCLSFYYLFFILLFFLVIGVRENDLWFHIDVDRGASLWQGNN